MPLFVIIGFDVANSADARAAARPTHVARLEALSSEGRLVLAGPTPIAHGESTMSGSIIVADFADEKDCQAWVDAEPYLAHGVYSHVQIRPFVKVLP